jgi:topoisomerase-4 subunit B
MAPAKRNMLRVVVPEADAKATDKLVERLMGRKPELRLAFIQEHAPDVADLDI